MNLDETIKHCEEVAHAKRIESNECISVNDLENAEACYGCSEYYKQIALWLTELKQLREAEISTPPKTNGDRIRKMTDEELAVMLDIHEINEVCNYCAYYHNYACHNGCYAGILEWMQKEADKDARTD